MNEQAQKVSVKRIPHALRAGLCLLLAGLVFCLPLFRPVATAPKPTKAYGVFIGLNREKIQTLYGYKRVVIDAQGFKAGDIKKLHKRGIQVYSYLNIGSVEKGRSYYKKYKGITLGAYEDWPDERWVDVSKKKWQDFVVKNLAKKLDQKGVDGFFLDNADVYYQYPKKAIYKGLVKILKGLGQYGKKVVINGGDTFVKKLLKTEKSPKKLVYGVNQECVLTRIDFEGKRFEAQGKDETAYFKQHLKRCKKAGLRVFLTEYSPGDAALEKKIRKFARAKGYKAYISHSLQLDGSKGF